MPTQDFWERWIAPFLLAIGFDGEHTGRAVLILLGIAAAAALAAYLAVRQARREARDYARRGREAVGLARSRLRAALRRPTPEERQEQLWAETLRAHDPSIELGPFKRDRERDFAEAMRKRPWGGTVVVTGTRLIEGSHSNGALSARLRFDCRAGSPAAPRPFAEEWTFTRPLAPGADWNTVEERRLTA